MLLKMIMFTMTPPCSSRSLDHAHGLGLAQGLALGLALSDCACAVVAGSLVHNIMVLGKNEKAYWSVTLRDVVLV